MGVGQVKAIGQSLLRWGLLLILGGYCLAVSAQASEAGLRVAFVYNFIKFIEWPALLDRELSLCVLGAGDETRSALAPIDNKVQQKRSIQVIYIDHVNETNEPNLTQTFSHCELLYVTEAGAAMPLPQLGAPVRAAPSFLADHFSGARPAGCCCGSARAARAGRRPRSPAAR